jgi:hypothetical protein
MRYLFLLGGLLLPMLLPASALAGNCPAPEGAVVDKEHYRFGDKVEFFGTYHDFADPGTVTITFERSLDGDIREFTAFNMPDGAWIYQLTFDSAFAGRWDVTVVVDQTGSIDTCRDRVTVGSIAPLPNTASTVVRPSAAGDSAAILAILGLIGGLVAFRRGRQVAA